MPIHEVDGFYFKLLRRERYQNIKSKEHKLKLVIKLLLHHKQEQSKQMNPTKISQDELIFHLFYSYDYFTLNQPKIFRQINEPQPIKLTALFPNITYSTVNKSKLRAFIHQTDTYIYQLLYSKL